jgi:hypothetical protein
MKNFKLSPTNITQVQDQSLWLNKNITINNKIIIWKNWQNKGINTISNLLNHENKFLSYTDISQKYNINCTHLDICQIQSSIPKIWKQILKQNLTSPNINNSGTLKIEINDKYKDIQNTRCKDFYWHLINIKKHVPTAIIKWSKVFASLNNPEETVWRNIFKMPFKTIRDTKIQTIQYRINHRIIPCNEWLYNIKIKNNNICNFCNQTDNIQHFFIHCPKNKLFWKTWSKWWNDISKTNISNCNNTEECILFGFDGKDDLIQALNYSVLIAKEYMYLQKLTNDNKIDFLTYLPILKNKLVIEKLICEKENKLYKFQKYNFIYENL